MGCQAFQPSKLQSSITFNMPRAAFHYGEVIVQARRCRPRDVRRDKALVHPTAGDMQRAAGDIPIVPPDDDNTSESEDLSCRVESFLLRRSSRL